MMPLAASGLDPAAARLAWCATVLSVLGLILTLSGSGMGAVLFLLAWGLVALPWAGACLRLVFRTPGVWLLPGYALLSVLWSQAPLVTLRAATQLALTVGVAALAAGLLRPRAFVSALAVSLLVGALLSLAFGRYGVDGMTGAAVFLGIFASKNTMALFMSLLAIFSAAVLLDRGQPPGLRLLGVLGFLVSIPLLLLARSAGAVLTTLASLAVLGLVALVARLRPAERLLLALAGAALLLPALVLLGALYLNGTLAETLGAFVSGVLGKDATLTGRTLLWSLALEEVARHPWLGTGYYAFWQQGNLLAESIWRHFSITSRGGFHFHNTLLEFAVELGWPGAAAMVLTTLLGAWRAIAVAMADRGMASAALVATLACLASRMLGEVDTPYPFAIGTFLFFAILSYGSDHARAMAVRPAGSALAWPAWRPMPGPVA